MSKKMKGFITIRNVRGVYCTACGAKTYCYSIQPLENTLWMGWGNHSFCSYCCITYIIMADENGTIVSVVPDNGFLQNAGNVQTDDDEIPF